SRWAINTQNEADKKVSRDQVDHVLRVTRRQLEDLQQRKRDGRALVERWHLVDDLPLFLDREAGKAAGDPTRMLQQACERSRGSLQMLQEMKAPGWLRGLRPWILTFLAWVVVCAPAFLFDEWYLWLAGAT